MAEYIVDTEKLDPKTGEVIEFSRTRLKTSYINQRYFLQFCEAMHQMAVADMPKSTYRVRDAILSDLIKGQNNKLIIRANDLSAELNICKREVNRAVKALVDSKVLLVDGERIPWGYQLNPNFAWCGSSEDRPKDLSNYPPLEFPNKCNR